jgi:hypothetical protein
MVSLQISMKILTKFGQSLFDTNDGQRLPGAGSVDTSLHVQLARVTWRQICATHAKALFGEVKVPLRNAPIIGLQDWLEFAWTTFDHDSLDGRKAFSGEFDVILFIKFATVADFEVTIRFDNIESCVTGLPIHCHCFEVDGIGHAFLPHELGEVLILAVAVESVCLNHPSPDLREGLSILSEGLIGKFIGY